MLFAFGEYELDEERLELRKDGAKVAVQPKIIDLLFHLVRHRDRVVVKRELLDAVWPGVTISEAALSRAILRGRRAIGDELQRTLVTVHGRGFRFAADVEERSVSTPNVAAESAADTTFVGRTACVAALQARLDDAFDGRGSMVWLVGDAGIGKSRTAAELVRRARVRAARVCSAHAPEQPNVPGLWLWAQVARAMVDERPDSATAAFLESAAPIFAGESIPPGDEVVLFDAFARSLAVASRSTPIVVVLDDLQWADEASLRLLSFIAHESSREALLVVGVYRDMASVGDARMRDLRSLAQRHAAHSIPLRGFGIDEVRCFVETETGVAPSEALARELMDWSGGNPRYLHQLLKTERVEQALNDAALELTTTMNLEQGLVDSVCRHVDEVSSRARALLEIAAVVGREIDVARLAVVSGLGQDELLGLLDEIVRARLVVGIGSRGYRFEPALVRDVVYGLLRNTDRVTLHMRAGERLSQHFGDTRDLHAAELARHFVRALPKGDPAMALGLAVQAAEQDTARGDHRRAAKHWRLAEQALAHARGERTRRIEVQLGLASALAAMGQEGRAREAFLDATVLGRALGAPERLAEAAMGVARFSKTDTDVALGRSLLDEALAALGPLEDEHAIRLRAEIRALIG